MGRTRLSGVVGRGGKVRSHKRFGKILEDGRTFASRSTCESGSLAWGLIIRQAELPVQMVKRGEVQKRAL